MLFQSLKRVIGDMMLYFAGISRRNVIRYTERYEKVGQQLVSVIHLYCYLMADIRECDITVTVDVYISAVLKQAYCSAHARLGKAHMLTYVNGAHVGILLG